MVRLAKGSAFLAALLAVSATASAQQMYSTVPSIGGNPAGNAPTYSGSDMSLLTSSVSFIDSALPRTMVRTYLDVGYGDHRPTRAEYLFSHRGFAVPERRVDSTDLNMYMEYAVASTFSLFMEQPWRWVNPDLNANRSGAGDMNFGFKFALINTDALAATFQLRMNAPIARKPDLATRHWCVEPAILVNYQVANFMSIEAEARYWMPLTKDPYAGDIFRYGIGFVVGQQEPGAMWFTPVAEVVAWSIMGGKVDVVEPLAIDTQGASGQTIVNGNLGVRFGFPGGADLYAGYSHALTGTTWYKDLFRVEFRMTY